jgi:hypothetical protein
MLASGSARTPLMHVAARRTTKAARISDEPEDENGREDMPVES